MHLSYNLCMKIKQTITTSISFAKEEHSRPDRYKPVVDMFVLLFEWSQQEKVKQEHADAKSNKRNSSNTDQAH
jgi:hypothetical protein